MTFEEILLDIDVDKWQLAPDRREPSRLIKWVPLLKRGYGNFTIGISSSGRWSTCNQAGVLEFTEQGGFVPFLPFLEGGLSEMRAIFSDAISSNGIPIELLDFIPVFQTAITGIRAGGYWANLAVSWVKELELSEKQKEGIRVEALRLADIQLKNRLLKYLR